MHDEDSTVPMDFNIPPVLDSDQLLDKAFNKASKKQKESKDPEEKKKKTTSMKLNTVAHTIEDTLKRYEDEFPSLDTLPPFYNELIDIVVGISDLKKALSSINWTRRRVKRILMQGARDLMSLEEIEEMEILRKEVYGRTSSLIDQINDDLFFLDEAREKLNSFPDIQMDRPTVVVAGYPNVGKSLLMSKISSGKPKVAVYPFTTQEVGIGHFTLDHRTCQLIDIPGLLARPKEERNDIEIQAETALETLADLIVFLYDPSQTCGYPMEKQEALANEIKEEFPDIPMIKVNNKSDLIQDEEKSERLNISAKEEKNLDDLLEHIKENLNFKYSSEEYLGDVRTADR